VNSWKWRYDGFDPAQEKLREALCTLGNGYFATRGAAPESQADNIHYPGTYLAGGYNRLKTEISGRIVENEDLVNLPNWLPLTFRPDEGTWFRPEEVEILSCSQELDIRRGVLLREMRFRDGDGRLSTLRQRRLVHMLHPHIAALETVLVPENWSGAVEFRSALDGKVLNDGVERYRKLNSRHLEPVAAEEVDEATLFLQMRTNQSKVCVSEAARTRVFGGGGGKKVRRQLHREADYIAHLLTLPVRKGGEIRVEKVVALYCSRDSTISESGLEARKAVARAGSFAELLETHAERWEQLWRHFDLEIDVVDGEKSRDLLILHLHIFHLLQTVSMHTMDLDVGVPSRGWHGEAYRGHIFWDELFIFPFFNLRVPEITRSLLKYRYRRLGEARAAAREYGLKGAMYPWQSGSNGREESQQTHLNPESGRWIPDNTHLQRHVNAAIAYNTWQYFQVTRDTEFLSFYGAEMLLEIARFWAGLARWNEERQRYEIRGVMGPDEYHDAYPGSSEIGLRNNSYTNVMVSWVMSTALEALKALGEDRRQELCETLDLLPEEFESWDRMSRRMYLPFHGEGIISQFEGYEKLEEFDWEKYREKYGPVMRLDRILEAEGDTPNRYKASKQADVLMLFYLFSAEELGEIFGRLGYPFGYDTIPKNIDYYIQRTSHGSTLSQVVHSWVLARANRPRAWSLFEMGLKSDVEDIQGGTTPEGIHLGAMAGTVDLVQRAFTGIEMRGDTLRFNPRLPEDVERLCLRIRYRGQAMEATVTRERLKVECLECGVKPVHIICREEECRLRGGEAKEFDLT
jgi:alpha,alpha-trehalase